MSEMDKAILIFFIVNAVKLQLVHHSITMMASLLSNSQIQSNVNKVKLR